MAFAWRFLRGFKSSPPLPPGLVLRRAGLVVAAIIPAYGAVQCAAPSKVDMDIPRSRETLFYTTLLRRRTVFLSGPINDTTANSIVAQLLYLELEQPGVPITMFITSGGGLVYPGLAIYDVMQSISSPVHTICVGHAESMAAVLLAAGEPGCRFALPHGRMMLHQPSLGVGRAFAQDVMIQAKEGERTRTRLVDIIAKHTGRSVASVNEALERNNYLDPSEGVSFGLIDKVTDRILVPEVTKIMPAEKTISEKPAADETSASGPAPGAIAGGHDKLT